MALFEITGKVVAVNDVQTFASGFTKRDIVVNTSANPSFYSPVPFSFKKDKTDLLDGVKPGDEVKVKFGIDGRRWDGQNGTRYFVDLTGFGLEVTKASEFTQGDAVAAFKAANGGEFDKAAFVALCKKLVPGKSSKEFTSADWQTVAENKPTNEFGGVESDPEELPF